MVPNQSLKEVPVLQPAFGNGLRLRLSVIPVEVSFRGENDVFFFFGARAGIWEPGHLIRLIPYIGMFTINTVLSLCHFPLDP